MKDERIDFDALLGDAGRREERVARRVMADVANRPVPRADLLASVRAVAAPALAIAVLTLVLVRVVPAGGASDEAPVVTVGTALGISAAADRVIRGAQPATARQLLAVLEDGS